MARGGIYDLITNDGKQDKMLMATKLLDKRLCEIRLCEIHNKPSTFEGLIKSTQELDLYIPIELIELIWEFKNAINTITVKVLNKRNCIIHQELSNEYHVDNDLLKGRLKVYVWE